MGFLGRMPSPSGSYGLLGVPGSKKSGPNGSSGSTTIRNVLYVAAALAGLFLLLSLAGSGGGGSGAASRAAAVVTSLFGARGGAAGGAGTASLLGGSSADTFRTIVPAVVPALAAELKRAGVASVLLLGCATAPGVSKEFEAAGLAAATCVSSLGDADAFFDKLRRQQQEEQLPDGLRWRQQQEEQEAREQGLGGSGSGDDNDDDESDSDESDSNGGQLPRSRSRLRTRTGAGAGAGALPRRPRRPSAAVVLVHSADNAGLATASALLAAPLVAAASGAAGGAVPLATVAVNVTRAQAPVRAAVAWPPGWPNAGRRLVFFQQTSVYLDAFNKIYKERIWSNAGGGSGTGSTLEYTRAVREALPRIVKRYGVRSMVDSSCGSMHWMPLALAEIEKDAPGFRFFGSDVVCPLIERHRKNFTAAHPNWKFECLDYGERIAVWVRRGRKGVGVAAAAAGCGQHTANNTQRPTHTRNTHSQHANA